MNKVGRQELTQEVNTLLDKDYTEELNNIKQDTESIIGGLDLIQTDTVLNSDKIDQTKKEVLESIEEIKTVGIDLAGDVNTMQESINNIKTLRSVSFEYNEKASGTNTGLELHQLAGLHSFSFVGTVGDEAYNGVGFYETNPSIAFVQKTVAGGGGIYVQPYNNKIATSSGDFLTGTITFYYFG